MGVTNYMAFFVVFIGLMLPFLVSFCLGYTYEEDVYAINNLYASLGSPRLFGWSSNGGDPCMERWQGVQCVNSNITGIVLNDANLEGELGDSLWNFSSMIIMDLSSNHIGGNIPYNLPRTVRKFFLSANQLTGRIPSSLWTLDLLSDLSLNNNHLSGELPDSFQTLTNLINLDISFNNLSGLLPPSLASLSSLTKLHIQNNQLAGLLDVLQDLRLQDLNVENNLFWGPLPANLLNIPNFRKDGNPFNTTPIASPSMPKPPLPSPSPSPLSMDPPSKAGGNSADFQSAQDDFKYKGSKFTKFEKVALVTSMILAVCIMTVVIFWCFWKCYKRTLTADKIAECQKTNSYKHQIENHQSTEFHVQPNNQGDKVITLLNHVQNSSEECGKDMTNMGTLTISQAKERANGNYSLPTGEPKILDPSILLTTFKIASLQQYTNSFAEEHLIREDALGKVYHALLPDGQQLTVKTLDTRSQFLQKDEDFLDLLLSISKLSHDNILKLVGYCMEHGQRILVYRYCSKRTLEDVLHFDDEFNKKLSWFDRIQIALGAARALEYLHETCQPPVVHRNFNSSALLLDEKLIVHVSDCGLFQLILLIPVNELSEHMHSLGYHPPEFITSKKYTHQSDIYSFGVIMLELLTGRKSYDSTRPRGEHCLATWAINQLHDIELLSKMVDPNLFGTYSEKSLSRFADIISLCLEPEPEFRPPMSDIVQMISHMLQ